MVKNNQKPFGVTLQNPRVELDHILDIDFLKLYQTKKQFFDNSFVEPLANNKSLLQQRENKALKYKEVMSLNDIIQQFLEIQEKSVTPEPAG